MAEFEDEIMEEEFDTVIMTDEDGLDMEFVIIDRAEDKGINYLLVVESDLVDDEEPVALILKEIADEDDTLTYEMVEDDEEFDRVADLFGGDDYEVEIDD